MYLNLFKVACRNFYMEYGILRTEIRFNEIEGRKICVSECERSRSENFFRIIKRKYFI